MQTKVLGFRCGMDLRGFKDIMDFEGFVKKLSLEIELWLHSRWIIYQLSAHHMHETWKKARVIIIGISFHNLKVSNSFNYSKGKNYELFIASNTESKK